MHEDDAVWSDVGVAQQARALGVGKCGAADEQAEQRSEREKSRCEATRVSWHDDGAIMPSAVADLGRGHRGPHPLVTGAATFNGGVLLGAGDADDDAAATDVDVRHVETATVQRSNGSGSGEADGRGAACRMLRPRRLEKAQER